MGIVSDLVRADNVGRKGASGGGGWARNGCHSRNVTRLCTEEGELDDEAKWNSRFAGGARAAKLTWRVSVKATGGRDSGHADAGAVGTTAGKGRVKGG